MKTTRISSDILGDGGGPVDLCPVPAGPYTFSLQVWNTATKPSDGAYHYWFDGTNWHSEKSCGDELMTKVWIEDGKIKLDGNVDLSFEGLLIEE